jgi:hypothetical protein
MAPERHTAAELHAANGTPQGVQSVRCSVLVRLTARHVAVPGVNPTEPRFATAVTCRAVPAAKKDNLRPRCQDTR